MRDYEYSGSTQPLSASDIVSAGAKLYRSHLKEYFLLALKAYAWAFVPVYGWAKTIALFTLISRLAFGELVNQPESIKSGQRFVYSRKWRFLLVYLYLFLAEIAVFSLLLIIGYVVFSVFKEQIPILVIFSIIAIIAFIIAYILIALRLYLVEMPLAIEENITPIKSISRSWELTKGSTRQIFLVLVTSSLILMPIQILVSFINSILRVVIISVLQNNSSSAIAISSFLSILVSFLINALIVPFLQTTQAVVYYELRSRCEGLGLQLRDHEI